jgi:PPOX class probable F420-dependent enzyme
MAKQRDAIRMSDDEVTRFLDESKTLIVASLDKEGSPHLTALWFARQGLTLLFETYGASQKVVNLRRDPRIAVLCEAGESYDQLRGVSIKGKAEIVDAGERLTELMAAIIQRNNPGLAAAAVAEHAVTMAPKRVVVVVHPERVISWDHRKLAAAMRG